MKSDGVINIIALITALIFVVYATLGVERVIDEGFKKLHEINDAETPGR